MKRISKHISYSEAVRSQTATRKGIDNAPNELQLSNMRTLAKMVFEPLREWAGVPIYVSSFFRSFLLNLKIGGSKTSQHYSIDGSAIDLDGDLLGGVTNRQIFEYIRDNLSFDQLIWEFGNDKQPAWVHVSYRTGENRGEILRAYKDNKGKTKYKRL